MGMMRTFQRMSKVLINHLDHDEGRESLPNEGSQCPPLGSCSVHREIEKVNFPKFWSSTDGLAVEYWLENMEMCLALHDYISNMKVRMTFFQLKGSALLWWKTLLPQLNMSIKDVSWELFNEQFRERCLYDEFNECHLNEINTFQQGSCTVPKYEARFMEFLRYSLHLNTKKLKVNKFLLGIN
jgi:hypothetical protein